KARTCPFAKGREPYTAAVSGRYAVNKSQRRLTGVKKLRGIGIFPDFVLQDALAAGKVAQVLQEWKIKSNYHGEIAMQYAQPQYMPARLRVFLGFALEHLRPRIHGKDPTCLIALSIPSAFIRITHCL
ncbi:hypothetical protein LT012_19825, partial [Vibrio cholerae]|nr:hypothetical protein [Vibrio cholerae]